MRHRKAGRKFGRQSGQRHALLNGLVTNLVRDERIRTTDAKAKEIRRYAERTITWGTSVAELVEREPESLAEHERARIVHAMRMARRTVRDRIVLHKLFHEIAPRFLGRPGGYTRIVKIGNRHGDAAPMSLIELLPGENGHETEEPAEEPKGKTKKGKAKAAAPAEQAAEEPKKKGRRAASAEAPPTGVAKGKQQKPKQKPKNKKEED
jgi:large subunit ribosomal protein L17